MKINNESGSAKWKAVGERQSVVYFIFLWQHMPDLARE